MYDAVNSGRIEVGRLRRALSGLPLPRDAQGRIVLAVDVSAWLRPDAATGQWREGDPPVLLVFDAGYDIVRLAWLLRDLPVQVVGRLRSDRVFHLPAPARTPGQVGRSRRHGPVVDLDKPATHPPSTVSAVADTTRYGNAFADAWDRAHQQLPRRAAWTGHRGELPVVAGTLVRLVVDRLPGDRQPKPVWLWTSATGLDAAEVDRLWQAYLRRFDIEHVFRMIKQTLGWTRPRIRDPRAADRWTWLTIVAYTQLRLARERTADLRQPWERRVTKPGRLTPARLQKPAGRHAPTGRQDPTRERDTAI